MKKLFLFLTIVLYLPLSSCSLFEDLCEGGEKADLLFSVMSMVEKIIPLGGSFSITSTVANVLGTACDITASSGVHNNKYIALFTNDPNTGFQKVNFKDPSGNEVEDANANTPSIEGGGEQAINLNFTMNTPGTYMIMGTSDSEDNVDERDETNNGRDSDQGQLGGLVDEESSESRSIFLKADYLDGLIEGKDYIIFEVIAPAGYVGTIKEGELPVITFNGYTIN